MSKLIKDQSSLSQDCSTTSVHEENTQSISLTDSSGCKSELDFSTNLKHVDTNASSCGEDKSTSEGVSRITESSHSGDHEGKRMLASGIQTIVIMNKFTHSKHIDQRKQNINIVHDKRKRLFEDTEVTSSCVKPSNYKKMLKDFSNHQQRKKSQQSNRFVGPQDIKQHQIQDENSQQKCPQMKQIAISKIKFQYSLSKSSTPLSTKKKGSISRKIVMSSINKIRCSNTRGNPRVKYLNCKKFLSFTKESDDCPKEANDEYYAPSKYNLSRVSITGPRMMKDAKMKRWDPYSSRYVVKSQSKPNGNKMMTTRIGVKKSIFRGIRHDSFYQIHKKVNSPDNSQSTLKKKETFVQKNGTFQNRAKSMAISSSEMATFYKHYHGNKANNCKNRVFKALCDQYVTDECFNNTTASALHQEGSIERGSNKDYSDLIIPKPREKSYERLRARKYH
ncbi:unnamed protein product [Moneuplotes crassus]|uniref:Uncharacterized protein n=1 Tax=Euplotes crassus TaxID=5936 RepID=A0AAD1UIA3_EUPCR|nr:unnamed protein product [Moneuplotes crassus]